MAYQPLTIDFPQSEIDCRNAVVQLAFDLEMHNSINPEDLLLLIENYYVPDISQKILHQYADLALTTLRLEEEYFQQLVGMPPDTVLPKQHDQINLLQNKRYRGLTRSEAIDSIVKFVYCSVGEFDQSIWPDVFSK